MSRCLDVAMTGTLLALAGVTISTFGLALAGDMIEGAGLALVGLAALATGIALAARNPRRRRAMIRWARRQVNRGAIAP